jgi:thiol-disulfide isomerase/thioredoxin
MILNLRPIRSFFVILVIFVVTLPIIHAAESTDSVGSIRAALPDSISLDNKVVYVDFWASWCVPCRQSFPWMQTIYEKYHRDGLEIVAVNVDKDHAAAMKFLDEHSVAFPILYDSTGSLAKLYELKAMPTSLIYDRDGHLVQRHQGFRMEETESVERTLQTLLKQEASE